MEVGKEGKTEKEGRREKERMNATKEDSESWNLYS